MKPLALLAESYSRSSDPCPLGVSRPRSTPPPVGAMYGMYCTGCKCTMQPVPKEPFGGHLRDANRTRCKTQDVHRPDRLHAPIRRFHSLCAGPTVSAHHGYDSRPRWIHRGNARFSPTGKTSLGLSRSLLRRPAHYPPRSAYTILHVDGRTGPALSGASRPRAGWVPKPSCIVSLRGRGERAAEPESKFPAGGNFDVPAMCRSRAACISAMNRLLSGG